MGDPKRDLVWDAIVTVAERLHERAAKDDRWDERERLVIRAERRRSLATWTMREGLYFGNLWTDGFEIVRQRRMLTTKWVERQPVAQAASRVGHFVEVRPDMPSAEL